MKFHTIMSCQQYEVVSDVLSLEVSCVNTIKTQYKNNGEILKVIFNPNDQRLELLCEILSYFHNSLESHFEKLMKPEQLIKGLTAMYCGLGITKKHEGLFITGEMDVENQCSIWSRIISYIKDYSPVGSNDLNPKIENGPRVRNLINNPHLKEMLMYRVNDEGNNTLLGSDNKRNLQMLSDIEKDIKRLEDMIELSEKESNEENGLQVVGHTGRSLEDSNAKKCDIEQLISEWLSLVDKYWLIHCGSRDNHSHYSSGFESADSLSSFLSESTFEDSMQRDLTEAIHRVYNECHNISEVISFLKEIKLQGIKIIEKNKEKDSTKIEKLRSFMSSLIPK